jgi:hypothetical protein
MERLNQSVFGKFEGTQIANLSAVNGGKKTDGGTFMLDDVEMCYESDTSHWWTSKVKKNDVAPCGCDCQ